MENKNLTIFDKFKSLLEEHKPNGLNENNIDEIIKIIKDENLKEDFSSKKYNRKLRKAVEAIINDENCKDLISLKIKIAFIDYYIENNGKDKAMEYIKKLFRSMILIMPIWNILKFLRKMKNILRQLIYYIIPLIKINLKIKRRL